MTNFAKDRKQLKHYLFLRRFAPSGVYGGCEKLLIEWLNCVDYKNIEITLAVTKAKSSIFCEVLKQNNIPVSLIEFPFTHTDGLARKFINMLLFVHKIKPDAIIFIQGGFYDFTLPEVFAAYLVTKGNVYMTEHSVAPLPLVKSSKLHFGFLPGLGLWRFKEKFKFGFFRANVSKKILAVGKAVKESLVKQWRYPEGKIRTIYHGVDLLRFSPDKEAFINMRKKLGIQDSDIVIISIARFSKEKCLDRLIKAFDVLSKHQNNLKLLMLGSGSLERDIKDLAGKTQCKEKILFLGHIEDVANYLKMSDIYVLSSDNEGLPIALLEAQATGLICIATKTSGANEILKDNFNGFLVEKSSEAILHGLEVVLKLSKEQKERISNNAREHSVANFDNRIGIRQTLNFFGVKHVGING